ncbi:MAG: hypothetical protein ACRD30_04870 [Bryobacteraceae bacterium]
MDGERKYRQRGYQDSERDYSGRDSGNASREERPRPQGPRPPIDVTGPRLPRMVQTITGARCYNCSTILGEDADWRGNCPKCGTALHCCKQCAHFEPSTRFQCLKPVPERISPKDQANACELFKPRLTVARDGAPNGNGNGMHPATAAAQTPAPKNATDARAIFDSLFKKPD